MKERDRERERGGGKKRLTLDDVSRVMDGSMDGILCSDLDKINGHSVQAHS